MFSQSVQVYRPLERRMQARAPLKLWMLGGIRQVVMFHLPRYENTVKTCKASPDQVKPSDLTFATKFGVVYLFIKVKGSHPMTYQFLTVDMARTAKDNEALIYRPEKVQACLQIRIRLHRFSKAIAKTLVEVWFGHEKWRPTQQIGRRHE